MGNPQDPYGQQPYQQPPQQPYQQPYGGAPVPPPPAPSASAQWGKSDIGGLDANVAAGLSYLWFLGVIFFFIEKTNKFVRFHAAQSIVLTILSVAIIIVNIILGAISTAVAITDQTGVASSGFSLLSCGFSCVTFLLSLGIFALFIWGMILGFTGKYQKLPIVGDFAERLAGGPATPTM